MSRSPSPRHERDERERDRDRDRGERGLGGRGGGGGGGFQGPPPNDDGVRGGKSLLVRNLPLDLQETDLTDIFGEFGSIRDVHLPRNFYTKALRGFGFVEFSDAADAKRAMEAVNGKSIRGRNVNVEVAKDGRKQPEQMRARDGPPPHFGGNKGGFGGPPPGIFRGGPKGGGWGGPPGGYGWRRSPPRRDRYRDRSRSPYDRRDRYRDRSRSPYDRRDRYHDRSRSPYERRDRRDRDRSRSYSPPRRRDRSESRSASPARK